MFPIGFQVDFMFRRAPSVTAGVNIVKHRARLETSRVVLAPAMAQQKISGILCNIEPDSGIWKADFSRRSCCSGLGMSVGPYW